MPYPYNPQSGDNNDEYYNDNTINNNLSTEGDTSYNETDTSYDEGGTTTDQSYDEQGYNDQTYEEGYYDEHGNWVYYEGYGEYLALSSGNGCNNINSENFFYGKINQIFYDDSENPGNYYLCYRTGDTGWGQTDIIIEIIEPKITGISGCSDTNPNNINNTYTYNCPTEGGLTMNLWGEDFNTNYATSILEVNNFIVKNFLIVNSSLIPVIKRLLV